jgi:hypothetical protein
VNGTANAEWERGRAALIAPQPNFRATYFYALRPRASIIVTAGGLSLTYDNYDGDFCCLHFKGEYRVTEAIGLMLGYQFAGMDVQEKRTPDTTVSMWSSPASLLV